MDQAIDYTRGECSTCRARISCIFVKQAPTVLEQLWAIAQDKIYNRGTTIFRQGESSTGLFTICSGRVKLIHVSSSGRTITVGVPPPGSVLGLAEIMTGSSYEIGAEAFEKCRLQYIPKNRFLLFVRENPICAVELLRATCFELRRVLSEFCDVMGKVPCAARLLHTLQDLSKSCGRPTVDGIRLQVPFTEQDLADRIGCSRQWVCGLLSDLKARGIIRQEKGWIELISLSSSCDAA